MAEGSSEQPGSHPPESKQPAEFTEEVKSALAADTGLVETLAPIPERKDFYVFFSFDLVNSTLYKTRRPADWPIVTQRFYQMVEEGLRRHAGQIRLWKYVGDELLLFRRIRRKEELRECVAAAWTTLRRVVNEIARIAPEGRTLLSVKATLWGALVHELTPRSIESMGQSRQDGSEAPGNLLVRQPDAAGQGQVDFLGADIDIGFRIAKFAARGRMVLSSDLAYLLYRDRASDDAIENQVKIVAYEQLKGVWSGRRYPIIWYEMNWDSIKGTFAYDEEFDSDIVRRLVRDGPIADLAQVAKVYADTDRTTAAQDLWAFVNGLSGEDVEPAPPAVFRPGAEIHCVAVCVRRDTGFVLVGQRGHNKRRYPLHWEFGCGQLRAGETFGACLKRAYREDFDAELAVADAPIPIDTYVIPDAEDGNIPGVIFLAEVANPDSVQAKKHEQIEWVNPADLKLDHLGPVVPNFAESVQAAHEAWRKRVGR